MQFRSRSTSQPGTPKADSYLDAMGSVQALRPGSLVYLISHTIARKELLPEEIRAPR
jgi:hypothetical protein